MTAFEKIHTGMKLMRDGCNEISIGQCTLCPFYHLCIGQPIDPPEDWEIKEDS